VTPYTLRHSGLSWALAAGIPAVDVARFGGTSVTMLERVYHHLLVSSAESARARMDQFLAANTAAANEVRRGLGVRATGDPPLEETKAPCLRGFLLVRPA
jgi:hypothetical protein